MKKVNIKSIMLMMLIVIAAMGIGYKLATNKDNNKDDVVEEAQNEIIKQEEDTIKPKKIQSIDISMENQIYCAAILGDFEEGKKLSTDQYLSVVHNGIANGYINLPDVIEKKEISEEIVNSIVYKIFGIELAENKSTEGMEYNDGKYKIDTKRAGYIFLIQDKTTDSAAGTAYTIFNLYKEFASGKEEHVGKYEVSRVQNTVTGESYIKSLKKVQ
ncbi:MAG: hypothetical protein IKE01_00740 [Clostridia bacterium]|nr:hypothetical protein [Clostridia bacterium]